MSNLIKTFSQYGDVRRQAMQKDSYGRLVSTPDALSTGNETPHGLTPIEAAKLHERMDNFMPQLGGSSVGQVQDIMGDILPDGAQLSVGAGNGYRTAVRNSMQRTGAGFGNMSFATGQSGNGTFMTQQRPYQPEFESPDRQQYPVHRILANRYWRLFYKLDPVIGNAVDMYSELPWGNFELTGDGVDGEIKDALEYQCEETQLRAMLPY